jgi:hypothetical protein
VGAVLCVTLSGPWLEQLGGGLIGDDSCRAHGALPGAGDGIRLSHRS